MKLPQSWFRTGFALAIALVGPWCCTPVLAQSLFEIPTDTHAPAPVADSVPLHVVLHAHDAGRLVQVLGGTARLVAPDKVDYRFDQYPAEAVGTQRTWLEPTFIVDFHEAPVEKVYQDLLVAEKGLKTTDAAWRKTLVDFVTGKMHPVMDRGFEIASEVAVRPEGDCKSYAVMTVALARSAGIPARIAIGMVLVRTGTSYAAYGHAWAELNIDGRWTVADAAINDPSIGARYLPMGVLENEGMGYVMEIARLASAWVEGVDVVGPG